ncbi:hypothetical protein [Paenibacillus xerothermodurans]|uniref:Uncharacterized protein n=1 Tax=Paenibacillus xerothermodurans TaxID=1977292 RepID=A0A2W1N5R9_PAEXE|nr:hypothetical protein [Paenibacillus xerothermodurans]PZE20049.1 hypothetical protein CBW46_015320 [Paenibacillus xerothermodurans]
MVNDQKKTPVSNGTAGATANLKSFVESMADAEHPTRKDEKATGTNKHMDQQNRMIDQHNLRK